MARAAREITSAPSPHVPATVAGDIAEHVDPVHPDVRCDAVAERLSTDGTLFALPVIDEHGTPHGLLNRFRFVERLSQRFGRDLLLRRAVIECLDAPPLQVDWQLPVEQVGQQLFAGPGTHILDGFIVTREGRYFGVGTGVSLTRALSDLTMRRMREAVDEAARRTSAKSTFIANVSHELRTPLNGVIGISALLLDTPLAAEQRDLVELLRASGETLLTLIDDVLDYSKIEAVRFELESVPFDPREVFSDSVRILSARARGKHVAVVSDVDGSVPTRVAGDATRLRQILLNLGGNAVKFTERGHVRLRVAAVATDQDDVTLQVSVEDTGIGIQPDRIGMLFQPFVQADATIARRFGGTGLGLAICRELVERMGGQLSVASQPGQGTTFAFSIALRAVAADTCVERTRCLAFPDPVLRDGRDSDRAPRVLLAEDNAVNQLVATRLLRTLGCQVSTAADGAEAIAALSAGEFDIVLMDCQMPEIDGWEATRRIRRGDAGDRAREIPIIALTASAGTDSRRSCIDAGMNGFITKPVIPAALDRELHAWVYARRTPTVPVPSSG